MSFAYGFGLPHWQPLSGGFSPAGLFQAGVIGTWYDPSDPTTLFTTSTGTTPCAVPGSGSQVLVGLMLDKSQGAPGALGAELVTNGDFSSGTTGWGTFAGSIAVSGGEATLTANAGAAFPQITQTVSGLTVGRTYLMTGTARRGTTVDNAFISPVSGVSVQTSSTSATALRITFVAAATSVAIGLGIFSASTNGTAVFDNISVREIPGNHAIAFNDTTARPELSARVNLLTYSEEFDNGVWNNTAAGITVQANIIVAPNGTSTADKLEEDANLNHHRRGQAFTAIGVTGTFSVYAKAAERNFLRVWSFAGGDTNGRFFDLTTGVATGNSASMTDAGNGWWLCQCDVSSLHTTVVLGPAISLANGTNTYTGTAGSGIYIWGADLRPANIGSAIPSYQRIADQYTYDSNGFPSYLRFDGVDDSMYTPASINFSGTDKMSVFAGVRKLSDAAASVIVGNGADFATVGAWEFQANTGANATTAFRGRSSSGSTAQAGFTRDVIAPDTFVFASLVDYGAAAGAEFSGRYNGIVQAQNIGLTEQNTGNFGSNPLTIAARQGGASLRFNGHLYSLIIAGTQLQSGSITATEQYVAGKTGVQI